MNGFLLLFLCLLIIFCLFLVNRLFVMNKVSLSDIAQAVGVSKTTVSVVLNNKGGHISESTRKKIIATAKSLNYRPNRLARGLSMGRSNMIGLIVSDLSNIFYSIIAKSVEAEANNHGYEVMICSSNEDPEKETKILQMFRDRQMDGVILSSTQQVEPEIRSLQKDRFPFVLIDRIYPNLDTHSVTVDNFHGGFQAIQYLCDLKYERIGVITTLHNLDSMRERVEGYKAALKEANLPLDQELIQEVSFDNMDKQIEASIRRLMLPPYRMDALFITNNKLAVSALRALRRMKIRIPRDLAVLSFDDVEAFQITDPPLTALWHPAEEIGREAVNLLMDDITNNLNGLKPKKKIKLPIKLVVRESCEYNNNWQLL